MWPENTVYDSMMPYCREVLWLSLYPGLASLERTMLKCITRMTVLVSPEIIFLHVLPHCPREDSRSGSLAAQPHAEGCGCLSTKSISTLWAAKRLAKNNPTLPAIAPRSLGRRETGRCYRNNSFRTYKTHFGYQYPINPWEEGWGVYQILCFVFEEHMN